MNCWEFKKCADHIRACCPAYLQDKGLDCWRVTGTMCDAGRQAKASMEEKIRFCRQCEFYRQHANRF